MYNPMAESFSAAKAVPTWNSPSKGWSRFDQLFCEVADATPCEGVFRAASLVDELPSIARLAPRTQAEIIRVVIRDMAALEAPADGLVRVKAGVYRRRFAARS